MSGGYSGWRSRLPGGVPLLRPPGLPKGPLLLRFLAAAGLLALPFQQYRLPIGRVLRPEMTHEPVESDDEESDQHHNYGSPPWGRCREIEHDYEPSDRKRSAGHLRSYYDVPQRAATTPAPVTTHGEGGVRAAGCDLW